MAQSGKRKKRCKKKRHFTSTSDVRKHRASKAVEMQSDGPQNSTRTAIPNGRTSVLEVGNTYTGDVCLSDSASVVLGNVQQVFITINASPSQKISDLLDMSKHMSSPRGLFETGPSFKPETYTHKSQELILFNYSGDELASNEASQSYVFNMLYRSESYHVVHVVLVLQIKVQSRYWLNIKPDSPTRGSSDALPTDILVAVAEWLRENKSSKQSIYLVGTSDMTFRLGRLKDSQYRTIEIQARLCSRLLELSNHLKHWQCPWYYEDDLPRRKMINTTERSCFSLVYVPEMLEWVRETRFCPGDIAFESQIYSLRVLHCLKLTGCPGVPRLLGIVRDNNDCVVAFLTELPAKGQLGMIIHEGNITGNPVSRERREKWCRQLLHTVAEIHRHTYVVGMLGLRFASMFAVDADDNIVMIVLLRPMLVNHHTYPGSIPPEHRESRKPVRATAQTDLFQLGLVLWQIMGNILSLGREYLCRRAGCRIKSSILCSEPHADPIALTMNTEEYIQPLRWIINTSRSEDPDKRSTAAELLDMFPDPGHTLESPPVVKRIRDYLGAEHYQKLYSIQAECNSCSAICADSSFHCKICGKNDFDLCFRCLEKGRHCSDDQHLLFELQMRIQTGKCFSNVKESGQREVSYLWY